MNNRNWFTQKTPVEHIEKLENYLCEKSKFLKAVFQPGNLGVRREEREEREDHIMM